MIADIDIFDAGEHRGYLSPLIRAIDSGYVDDRGRIVWERLGEIEYVGCDSTLGDDDEPVVGIHNVEASATSAEAMSGSVQVSCPECGWTEDVAERTEATP